MASDLSSKLWLAMPALGRPFNLGSLYDFRNDEIIPVSLPECESRTVKTIRHDCASFSLVTSKKLSDQLKDVDGGINGSFQMSILTGMIELRASAYHLNQKKKSYRKFSNVRCQYHTAEKELTIDQSDKSKINNPEIAKTGATHIVTKIRYGAEATFTFTKQFKDTDDEQKVSDSLTLSSENLLRALIEGRKEINTDENSPENHKDIECHFEGDFQLPRQLSAPTTYEEAVKFASGFTNVLSDSIAKDSADGNKPLGVPCFVWLYPLDLMQVAKMSDDLESECLRIIDDYDDIKSKLNWMLHDYFSLVKQIRPFDKKLQQFRQQFALFRQELKTILRDLVIKSNGQEDDSSLKKLMGRIKDRQFSFNPNRLEVWLSEKHGEICMTKRFQDELKAKVKNQEKILSFPSPENLQETMTDSKVRFGFEIAFGLIKRPEPFLALMEKQVIDMDVNDDQTIETKIKDMPWYQDEWIEKEMSIFAKLINENFEDEIFALTAPDNEHEDDLRTSGLSFAVYYKGIKHFGGSALLVLCKHYQKPNLLEILQLLFDRNNNNVNCRNNEGWNALHLLCKNYKEENLINIVQLLIEKNIDVNCKNNDGWNALLFLCRFYEKDNLFDIVRLLSDRNTDINCKTKCGNNALLHLCEHYQRPNFVDIVRLFLDKNVNVNNKNNDGWKALHLVCRYYKKDNLFQVVKLLLSTNIDINSKEKSGNNALLILCKHYQNDNLFNTIQLFLDKNVNLDCRNNEGWNALLLVCRYYTKENLIDIIKLFLNKNMKTHSRTNSGCNVLHTICRYYHNRNLIDIVRLLLDAGIPVSATNNDGWNALLFVCRYYPNDNLIELVKLLLERGVDVNGVNNEGWNALHLVCQFYKQDNIVQIIQLLLDNKIEASRKTKHGYTALLLLCDEPPQTDKLYEIVRLLLNQNVEVNCNDDDGWNALHFLCGQYHRENLLDIVQLFVDRKIDVNCKTDGGWNALHLVCRYYRKKDLIAIVRLLLDQKIDINSQEKDGWNALHFVCRYQPPQNLMDLVRLLIEHNIDKNVQTTRVEIGSAHSFLIDRSAKEDVKDVIKFLESFFITSDPTGLESKTL